MRIFDINFHTTGQIGLNPRIVQIVCNGTISEVTALNAFNPPVLMDNQFKATDMVCCHYGTDKSAFGIFTPVITSSGVSLVAWNNAAITKQGITPVWGGGGNNHSFVVPGLDLGWNAICSIKTCSNAVAITTTTVGTDTLTVGFTGDPGAGTSLYFNATKFA